MGRPLGNGLIRLFFDSVVGRRKILVHGLIECANFRVIAITFVMTDLKIVIIPRNHFLRTKLKFGIEKQASFLESDRVSRLGDSDFT